jgi:hypothetical protein
MTFDRPLLLALAVLLPALAAALVVVGVRRRRARLARFGRGPAVERLLPPGARAPAWPRALRLGGALLCAGVALAGPRWGLERGVVRGEGSTSCSRSTRRTRCSPRMNDRTVSSV